MRKENDLIVRGTAFGKKSAPVPPPVSHEESQISLVSSDNPQGTSDYLNCKTLFRELELQTHLENSLKSNNLRDLEYHQADLQMRKALLAHKNPPKSVGNVITAKFKNDYKYMQPIHKETIIPDSVKGLIPGISIREQLEILRAQEVIGN
ncbi:hypothetical protein HDV04_002689 [Boothiomyces sp. JEL0838]|nr:hypothetical protein HDV04_002689 [Boothiomyces sp. JEL0838]